METQMTTTQRLGRFETAQEIFISLMADRARRMYEEQQKPHPDEEKIRQWLSEQNHFSILERSLRFEDTEGIEEAIATYGPEDRKLFEEMKMHEL